MTATELITHTPVWVWPLLAALLALGWMQTRARCVSLARALALPLVMLILTPATLVVRLAATGSLAAALAVWGAGTLGAALIGRRRALRPGEHFDAATRRLHLAGSWAPLLIILGIFCLRYAVAATQAVNPALAAQPAFVLATAALGGALNGWLVARAWALRMLARSSM